MSKQGFEAVDLDAIILKYSPSDEPLLIILPGGEALTFKIPTRKSELDSFLQDAARWYGKLPDWDSEAGRSHMFGEHLPRSAAEAIDAFMISEFSVEPKFEQLDALKLLRAPWLVREIVSRINDHNKTMDAMWTKAALDAAKKNSKTTRGTGLNAKSAENPSADTPTA